MRIISKIKEVVNRRKLHNNLKKNGVSIHKDTFITQYVKIDRGTRINGPAYLAGQKESEIYIGCYCAIGYNLRIRTRNHDLNYPCMQNSLLSRLELQAKYSYKQSGVSIGHGCWIGDNVMILPGVMIGNGAIIGAGSIVTKNIPSYAVAVGNPAKVIKFRCNKEVIEVLESSKWWNWSEEKMKKNKVFFNTKLDDLSIDFLENTYG